MSATLSACNTYLSNPSQYHYRAILDSFRRLFSYTWDLGVLLALKLIVKLENMPDFQACTSAI